MVLRSRIAGLGLLVGAAVLLGACGSPDQSGLAAVAAENADLTSPAVENPASASGHDFGVSLDEFLGDDARPAEASSPPDGFEEIEWNDLVPSGFSVEEISAEFDERIAAVEAGSPEANAIFAELQAEFDDQPVNAERNGDMIRLAGFTAPLTFEDGLITEFLLVPTFGACTHVPPPPVNQTIMVRLPEGQGLTLEEAWGAVWVTGTLTIEGAETDLATAGYTLVGAQTGVYESL